MTVNVETTQPDVYQGNGTTTEFSTSFKVLEKEHVGVNLLADGGSQEQRQVLDTDYSVAIGTETATVTMFVAPATGDLLSLFLDVPATQETDYTNTDPFDAETTEEALDKLTLLVQQNTTGLSLAMKFPTTDTGDKTLPVVEDRKEKLLGFDTNGEPVAVISGRAQVATPQNIILQAGISDYLLNYQVNSRDDLWIQARGLDFYTDEYEVVQTVEPNDTLRFLIDLTQYDGYQAEIRYIGDALLTGQVADGAINSPDKFSNNPVDLDALARAPADTKSRIIEFDKDGVPTYAPRFLVGESKMLSFAAPIPDGWVLEDGRELSRTTYAELFAAIGTTYGIGDGVTTFNVPNAQGRAPYGAGLGFTKEGGTQGTIRNLGDYFGSEDRTIQIANLPPHDHPNGNPSSTLTVSTSGGAIATTPATLENTGLTGGGQPLTTQSPGLVKTFIIYTGVHS